MDKLIVKGLIDIEGMQFHDIEGGFGKDKKAMLVKDIAEIHGREIKHINQNINNNIKRFTKGVDILDLKNGHFELPLQELGFSKREISISNNIYLLSERGYSKLLKILEDDVAWEQYEKLVNGYFNMRAEIPKLSKELQAILMLDNKQQYLETEVKDLKDNMPLFTTDCKEIQALVRKVGIKALGGYKSTAYNDKSLRGRIYSDIQHQLKREFDVSRYESIKRSQMDTAIKILDEYRVPTVLADEIILINARRENV